MRKQWGALVSLLGFAGSTMLVSAEAPILKGDQAEPGQASGSKPATTNPASKTNAATNEQKLQLKQQPLRQQNQANGAAGQTKANNNTGTCAQKNPTALTPPPPGQAGKDAQITKGNQQLTKGNEQLTKGNQQLTKGNQQLTKGNQQLTKGNQQLTKGNQQLTKGNQQLTKGNQQLTKGNQQLTKGIQN